MPFTNKRHLSGPLLLLIVYTIMLGGCVSPFGPLIQPAPSYTVQESVGDFTLLWSQSLASPITEMFVDSTGGKAYVQTKSGIEAINMFDGNSLWSFELANSWGYVFTTDFLVSEDGELLFVNEKNGQTAVAIDAKTGHQKWKTKLSNYISGNWGGEPKIKRLIQDPDYLYLGLSMDRMNGVAALNKWTGAIVWTIKLPSLRHISLANDGLLLILDDSVQLRNPADGSLITSSELPFRINTSWDLMMQNELALLGENTQVLKAIDVSDQQLKWTYTPDCHPGSPPLPFQPRFYDDAIYLMTLCPSIEKLSMEGDVLWRFPLESSPDDFVAMNGSGFILSSRGVVSRLDLETGEETGHISFAPSYVTPISIEQFLAGQSPYLLVRLGNNQLFAFRMDSTLFATGQD